MLFSRRRKRLLAQQSRFDREVDFVQALRSHALKPVGEHVLSSSVTVVLWHRAYSRVGSDYWDFVAVGRNRIALLIADVSGHGVVAGLVSILLRFWLEHLGDCLHQPGKLAAKLNEGFYKVFAGSKYYCTMVYGVLDLGTMRARSVSCGHPSPLVVDPGTRGVFPLVEAKDTHLILGVDRKVRFKVSEKKLPKNALLLYYTDGVREARNAEGDFYGLRRLMLFCSRHATLQPKAFVRSLVEEIGFFEGRERLRDDETIMAVKLSESKA